MRAAQFAPQVFRRSQNRVARLGLRRDRQNDDVCRRDARWDDHAVVVRVRHDDGADEACAHAPARRPRKLLGAVARGELDAARPGKILPEKMRGAGLDGLAILHHRLDAERPHRAGKTLGLRFFARKNRQRQMLAREGFIHAQHLLRLLHRLLRSLVRGVAFLPQELGGAEKNARAHLPSHDVRPLVDEDGKVAPGLHPFCVGGADDRLAGGSHHERLGELRAGRGTQFAIRPDIEPVVRDDRAFLCEALDVSRFFFEITERNEERKIRVPVAGRLEHGIERALHGFPDAVAPGLDNHAAAHVGVFREIGGTDDLLIPLGEILRACRGDGCLLVAHGTGSVTQTHARCNENCA